MHKGPAPQAPNHPFQSFMSEPVSGVPTEGAPPLVADILERITDGFFALDPQGRFVYVNRSAERILGRTRKELVGWSIWQLFPEATERRVFRRYQKAMAELVTVQFEEMIPSLGRTFRVRLFPSEDGLSVYFRDITEEMQTLEALRTSEKQFRQIAENVREVLYLMTADAEKVLYASPTFEEVWGISRKRLMKDASVWTRTIHPADRDRVLAAIPRMKEGSYEEEYRIVRSDGTLRWVLDRTFPVRNEAGEVYRIVGIAEDITADKQAAEERELLLAQEQASRHAAERGAAWREEVLAMVSHDLRNPLNSIHLSASALRDLPLSEEKRVQILDRILSVSGQMDRLIQMLLDTSRLESGNALPMERSAVDVGGLVQQASTLFQPQVEAKRIRLECELPDGCPRVYADKERILQVFWNLLGNAIKFTPQGGHVLIRAEAEGSTLRFSVNNQGPEIPPEHIERLFEPFWQEKRTERLGTGLGLPISRAIVQAHGGRIWVESSQARGTSFFFSLPIASAMPA